MAENSILLEDFPPGPLQEYRNKASFDWKKLKLLIEDECMLKSKVSSFLLYKQQNIEKYCFYFIMNNAPKTHRIVLCFKYRFNHNKMCLGVTVAKGNMYFCEHSLLYRLI